MNFPYLEIVSRQSSTGLISSMNTSALPCLSTQRVGHIWFDVRRTYAKLHVLWTLFSAINKQMNEWILNGPIGAPYIGYCTRNIMILPFSGHWLTNRSATVLDCRLTGYMPPPQRAGSTGEHKSGFRWSEASSPLIRPLATVGWHGRTESRTESFWARGSTVRVEDRTDMDCINCHLDYLVMSKSTLHIYAHV